MDEFTNAKVAGQVDADEVLNSIDYETLKISENNRYKTITSECQHIHKILLDYEKEGKLGNYSENPSLIGDYLGKLRLNANQLFAYQNTYIDIIADLQVAYANRRQALYELKLSEPKASPNSAEKHAREMTRVDEAKIDYVKHQIDQIKNEYERYNGICMYLQSRLKEFNTERMIG